MKKKKAKVKRRKLAPRFPDDEFVLEVNAADLRQMFRTGGTKHWQGRKSFARNKTIDIEAYALKRLYASDEQAFELKREVLMQKPTRDIAKTSGLLQSSLLLESEIREVYWKLAREEVDYARGDFCWRLHMYERPIHVFADTLGKVLFEESVRNKSWEFSSAWNFVVSLKDIVAFRTLFKRAVDSGLTKESIESLCSWRWQCLKKAQCDVIADILNQKGFALVSS